MENKTWLNNKITPYQLYLKTLFEYFYEDINLDKEGQDWIIQKTCLDRSYGARPLRRAIQRYIEDPVSDLIIQGKLKENQILKIYLKDGELYYRAKGSKSKGVPLSCGIV